MVANSSSNISFSPLLRNRRILPDARKTLANPTTRPSAIDLLPDFRATAAAQRAALRWLSGHLESFERLTWIATKRTSGVRAARACPSIRVSESYGAGDKSG